MNDLFDELVMDSEKKDQMRDTLRHTKAARKTPLIVMAGVAAAIALVMVIPFTRTAVVSAAEKLIAQFTTHNGTKVMVKEDDEERTISFDIDTNRHINVITQIDGEDQLYLGLNYSNNKSDDYAKLIDGRVYFVFDGQQTDVTDQISYNDYFRHEINNPDGSREVIFVGGTPDSFGWWSLYFNADGKYVFNQGNIPDANGDDARPAWYKNACHSEHVFCGEGDCEYAPDSYIIDIPQD